MKQKRFVGVQTHSKFFGSIPWEVLNPALNAVDFLGNPLRFNLFPPHFRESKNILHNMFAGAERALGVVDYQSSTRRVAYGSHTGVYVTSPLLSEGVVNPHFAPVQGLHTGSTPVTAVRWASVGASAESQTDSLLIAGTQGGQLHVWRAVGESFEELPSVQASTHAVTSMLVHDDKLIVGHSNGELHVYAQYPQGYTLAYDLELPAGFFPMALEVAPVGRDLVLFAGGTKPVVHVFVLGQSSGTFATTLPGHDDWVKSLSIRRNGEHQFTLATGCLDRVIRLWKLVLEPVDVPAYVETNKLKLLTSKEYTFETTQFRCKVSIDAVLMGHDDWIGELKWAADEAVLLSSSADSSLMLWRADPESGVWYPDVRLGGVSIKGASTATGASGGFFSTVWVREAGYEVLLTNGKTGSFRCWIKDGGDDYVQVPSITGAAKAVTDLTWGGEGAYLLGTSLDQTTRLYAREDGKGQWYEYGRPQIHGYDMIAIASLDSTKFISAGDEKVLRVFEMPGAVARMLSTLARVDCGSAILPETATLPVLGLSNKAEPTGAAAVEGDNNEEDVDDVPVSSLETLTGPPLEDVLQRYTLWPEREKLYGHGFEITTLDVSPDGAVVVSASRSNVRAHAGLRVFDTHTWLEVDQGTKGGLLAHDLTVTRVRFNGKGRKASVNSEIYMLAVSRDRKISLWHKDQTKFTLVEAVEKAHTRIVWDCAWVESEGDYAFVTVSRDREIKAWRLVNGKIQPIAAHKFDSPATAVDTFPVEDGKFTVAVGLDNGTVVTMEFDSLAATFSAPKSLVRASGSITRLAFAPQGLTVPLLAVGAADGSLRVISL